MPMETGHDLEHTTERLTEGLRCPWKWGLCVQQLSRSGTHRCVVKIFILHGAAMRHFPYALGHLWGGALVSVPDEKTLLKRCRQRFTFI